MAIRWLAAWWARASRNDPTLTSMSKLTVVGGAGLGGRGAGRSAARNRTGRRSWLASRTMMAMPRASAVGAWVVGIPVLEDAAQAAGIYQAIIDIYQKEPWAAAIVAKARRGLAVLKK